MSLAQYTLTDGDGLTRTFPEWGIEEAGAQWLNRGRDGVTLTLPCADFTAAEVFEIESYVSIARGGAVIFRGCVQPRRGARPQRHQQSFTLAGAWSELEGRQYLQPWGISGTSETQAFGRVILNANPALWSAENPKAGRVRTGTTVRWIVEYAIARGAPLQVGEIDPGVYAPSEVLQDVTCAGAIERALRFTPGAAVWFDYATNPPTFHCRQQTSLAALSMAVGEFAEMPEIYRGWESEMRAIVLIFHRTAQRDGGGFEHDYSVAFWPALLDGVPPEPGKKGVLTYSLDEPDELTFAGVNHAEELFNVFSGLEWTGKAVLRGATVPTAAGVGRVLNVTGGHADWISMRALIQRATDNFKTGTRNIEFGPPPHLSRGDLASLLKVNRRRQPVTDSQQEAQSTGESDEQNFGFDGKDSPESREYDLISISYCRAGSGKSAQVFVKKDSEVAL